MPTNSTAIQIADAVVTALNAAELSQPFSAVRYYLPEFELKELKDLHVSVVPAQLDEEVSDRARDRADYKIHVAVQKRVAKQDQSGLDAAAIDALMLLVEEIDDLLRHKPLAGFESARWVKTENAPIYDPKHLQENQQFTSLLAFTYRVIR